MLSLEDSSSLIHTLCLFPLLRRALTYTRTRIRAAESALFCTDMLTVYFRLSCVKASVNYQIRLMMMGIALFFLQAQLTFFIIIKRHCRLIIAVTH